MAVQQVDVNIARTGGATQLVPPSFAIDGIAIPVSHDLVIRRIQENDSIQQMLQAINTMLIGESHTSQAMGFEFR